MHRLPPLRGRPTLAGRKVLLIDRNRPTRDARASVLRSHEVEVDEAEELSAGRFLWQPNKYDLILLDVRRFLPGEALEFYEQINAASPRQCFAFLVGPPLYLSLTWPKELKELIAAEKQPSQSAEVMKRFLTAA